MNYQLVLRSLSKPMMLATVLLLGVALSFQWLTVQPVQAAPPFPDQRDSLTAGVNWLVETHQNDDGGYTSFSQGANQAPSTVAGTADALLAIASAGYNPAMPYPGKTHTPIEWLQTQAISVADYASLGGGSAGKLILGLSAANQNPGDFAGYNFVLSLTNQLQNDGAFTSTTFGGPTPFKQSLAILALKAVSEPIPTEAVTWLRGQQTITGFWGFGVDDTALSLMALVAAGVTTDDTAIAAGLTYLRGQQDEATGGFGPGSANSTALALQALAATGEDFYSTDGAWSKNGNTPLSALLELQSQSGAFQADFGGGPFDDFYSTSQALPGVTGKPYPLPSRYESASRGVSCLATLQGEAGGFPSLGSAISADGTSRAIRAIVAFGENPTADQWLKNGRNPVDALADLTPDFVQEERGGRTGFVMRGVAKAAQMGAPYTVTNFAGLNLVVSMTHHLDPTTGEYANTGFGSFRQGLAMLGLLESGYPVAPEAVVWLHDWLIANSQPDSLNEPDDLGIALNVLGRLGIRADESLDFLRTLQKEDASWTTFAAVNSSSEAAQGLVASQLNPFDPSWSKIVNGRVINVADTVMAEQKPDGCWGNNAYATTDGILLMSQQPVWPSGQISVSLTVSRQPTCGETNQIGALPGTEVTYCYRIQNTGQYSLTHHTVEDSRLGLIQGPEFALELAPGASLFVTRTTTLTTSPLTNILYWQATNTGLPGVMAADGAIAKVTSSRSYLPLIIRQ